MDFEISSEEDINNSDDIEYEPDTEFDFTGSEYRSDEEQLHAEEHLQDTNPVKQRKFIVFESCLLSLFSLCLVYSLPCKVLLKSVRSTMVVLEQICKHGHRKLWYSQPTQGTMPQGNLQLAAAILF